MSSQLYVPAAGLSSDPCIPHLAAIKPPCSLSLAPLTPGRCPNNLLKPMKAKPWKPVVLRGAFKSHTRENEGNLSWAKGEMVTKAHERHHHGVKLAVFAAVLLVTQQKTWNMTPVRLS